MRKLRFFSFALCAALLLPLAQVSAEAVDDDTTVNGTPECHPENGGFLCKDGHECLPAALFCDKQKDCDDGSDEFHGCEKLCEDMNCDQLCLPDPEDPMHGMCSCNPGFKLSSKHGRRCINLDECKEKWGFCSQTCEDTVGSFKCGCIDGFDLQPNNHSCVAKELKQAKIIYTTNVGLQAVSLVDKKVTHVADRTGQTVGVSVDVSRNHVYWSDVTTRFEAIYRKRIDDPSSSTPEVIVDTGLNLVESVAYDWVADNIYFTDSNLSHIGVCDRNGKACTILVQEKVDKPRGLALLPQKGQMFWTDWGAEPSIIKSGMDGSFPVAIIRTDLQWPNGIVIDMGSMRLYWLDASMDRIESSDLDGNDRRLIRESKKAEHGFGMQLFGDRVYWSDWGTDSISTCNKFHGDELEKIVAAPDRTEWRINGIALFHRTLQNKNVPNACNRVACSHICVLAPGSPGYKCLCPIGMRLSSSDKRTCKDDSSKAQLFIGHDNSIRRKYFNAIGRDVFSSWTVEGLHTVGAITYHKLDNSFIIFDSHQKQIITYWPKTGKTEVLVNRHLKKVVGLSVDHVSENLYWVDAERRNVEVLSLRTMARKVLYHDSHDTFTDIIAVPEFRSVYVTGYDADVGKIFKVTMDGDTVDIIVHQPKGIPWSIAYHPELEHVFWSDVRRHTIEHVTHDGSQTFVGAENAGFPMTMTIYGNKMYWIDKKTKNLKMKMIGSDKKETPMNMPSANRQLESTRSGNFSAFLGVIDRDLHDAEPLRDDHPCSPGAKHFVNCSHICVIADTEEDGVHEAICLCPEGMTLNDKDGKTCQDIPVCIRKTMFQCAERCIPEEFKCDGIADCKNGEDEKDCPVGTPVLTPILPPSVEESTKRSKDKSKGRESDVVSSRSGDDDDDTTTTTPRPSKRRTTTTTTPEPEPEPETTTTKRPRSKSTTTADWRFDFSNTKAPAEVAPTEPKRRNKDKDSGFEVVDTPPRFKPSKIGDADEVKRVDDGSSGATVFIVFLVLILIIGFVIGAVFLYRRNDRTKSVMRPYVQQWVKYVNDPVVHRWKARGGRRPMSSNEPLTNGDIYAQVYEARRGSEHSYRNPVYEAVEQTQLRRHDNKGEPRSNSNPDSGILTLNDNDYEDDVHNGHYHSYSQTDALLDKEFV